MAIHIRRRELIATLGSAVAWPLAARAQQSAMPVIGFLSSAPLDGLAPYLPAFHQGVHENEFIEGRNVTIEYGWTNNDNDRLQALAVEFSRRPATVIVAPSIAAALAAKSATAIIPIVFYTGADPVNLGLVTSFNRPGGNLTGVTGWGHELERKRLELLHELVPTATSFALLVNAANPVLAEPTTREVQTAAQTLGLQLHVLSASTEREIDAAFARLTELHASGLVIGADNFFNSRSERLAALALRHSVPAIYQYHKFAAAGSVMSYGGSITDAYRLVGVYTGRILKGEKPADLPVQQSTKVELVINLKTAKALGLTFPITLLGRADEVIE
jgi:putative tryptophan/tyrosine transport system substrate-binding protein